MSDTCAGACCAVFPIHKGSTIFETTKQRRAPDVEFILDMLIPLTRRQALARSRRLGYPDPPKYGAKYGLFTCRHWNEKTRLCGAYEKRPPMCQDYPYTGRECERGCGYKLAQSDEQKIAARDDSAWEWDIAANGWRPRSTTNFLWDAENGLLRRVPDAVPA